MPGMLRSGASWRMSVEPDSDRMYSARAQKHAPTIRSVVRSSCSRREGCRSLCSCNQSQSSPPTFSRSFPAGFSESRLAFALVHGGQRLPKWDRIPAHVGGRSIPAPNRQKERPAKAAGRPSRFIAQGLRSGASPKKCRLFLFSLSEKTSPPTPHQERGRAMEPISSEPTPSYRPWASARARPLADVDASNRSTAANSSGRRPAQSNLVGRLS